MPSMANNMHQAINRLPGRTDRKRRVYWIDYGTCCDSRSLFYCFAYAALSMMASRPERVLRCRMGAIA
jgi:hypothetical protein